MRALLGKDGRAKDGCRLLQSGVQTDEVGLVPPVRRKQSPPPAPVDATYGVWHDAKKLDRSLPLTLPCGRLSKGR